MRLVFLFICLSLVSCNLKTKKGDKKQTPKVVKTTPNNSETIWEAPASEPNQSQSAKEISIENLYLALAEKDETEFFRQFPKDFHQFQSYFGWNTPDDAPLELYEHSVHYIEHFFYLLRSGKYPEQEEMLINICTNGAWEADGVNYFQNHTLQYLKEKNRYSLINNLDDAQAKSVLFFLFDGPHPKFDADFAAALSPPKKKILETLFESGFYDHNENPDPIVIDPVSLDPIDYEGSIAHELSDFEEVEHFFITELDINNDGVLDKLVSADPYQEGELWLFIHSEGEYRFALKTVNFSEDGGHQIASIEEEETGFVVHTVFPDRGISEARHHIVYTNDRWLLKNTVYKTRSGNDQDAVIYECDVPQGLYLDDNQILHRLKGLPTNPMASDTCKIVNTTVLARVDTVSLTEIKQFMDKPLPTIFDYYQYELVEAEAIWSNNMFGRCCSETDMSYAELLTFEIQAKTSQTQYPASHLSDQLYQTAFVFTENSPPEIKLRLKRDNARHKSHTQMDIDQVLQPNDTLLFPFTLSLVNGHAASQKSYDENSRVKQMDVFLNHIFQGQVTLLDTPQVQEFQLNFRFTKNDLVTLVPISVYTGSKYTDVYISEIQSSLSQITHPSINRKYVIKELRESAQKVKNE